MYRGQGHFCRILGRKREHRVCTELIISHPSKAPPRCCTHKLRDAFKRICSGHIECEGALDTRCEHAPRHAGSLGCVKQQPGIGQGRSAQVGQHDAFGMRVGVHPSKMAPDEVGHRIRPIVFRVQARHKVQMLAAVFLEDLHVFLADFDGRLQAIRHEGGREYEQPLVSSLAALLHNLVAEGRQPLLVESALERHGIAVLRDAQPLGQSPCGGITGGLIAKLVLLVDFRFAAVVGTAAVLVHLVHLARGHTVVTEEDVVVAVQVKLLGAGFETGEVALVVPVLADHAHFGNDVPLGNQAHRLFQRAARGGRGVLRIKRQDDDAVVAALAHLLEHLGHARVLIAHRKMHVQFTQFGVVRREFRAALRNLAGQFQPVQQQGRTVFGPDLLVLAGAAEAAQR